MRHACAMVADDEMGAAQAAAGGELMNRGGLVARGATARFAYLLVVQRANSAPDARTPANVHRAASSSSVSRCVQPLYDDCTLVVA